MSRHVRTSLLLLTVLAVLAVPLMAAADSNALVLAADEVPAVETPPDAAEEEEEPWTARYLAPTTLLLGLVALGGSLLYYGLRVRGRYRVTS